MIPLPGMGADLEPDWLTAGLINLPVGKAIGIVSDYLRDGEGLYPANHGALAKAAEA